MTSNEMATADSSIEDVDTVALQEEDNPAPDDDEIEEEHERRGTISSARFNLLSTMVGGGSLSLPLAFEKSGNVLLAPILLILIALLSDFCFRIIISCAPPPMGRGRGNASYQSIVATALGPRGNALSTAIVLLMCFCGNVAYAVLLRDMLEPISDAIFPASTMLYRNISMLVVILCVTPLCSLKTITSLERFGAAGMLSIFIVGCCVVFRSGQCNWKGNNLRNSLALLPESPWNILDALPIFISCYVCHYNVPLAYNDLQDPTPRRVSFWIRSTTWGATLFYWMMGLAGSMYGICTPSGHVQGNVLLDFGEDDPLLLVGRLCLAFTVSMAFPMLVIPSRNIIWRTVVDYGLISSPSSTAIVEDTDQIEQVDSLGQPLLSAEDHEGRTAPRDEPEPSFWQRLILAALAFWSAAALACCVVSIEIVWDLLGSSLSILLSYLIPASTYLVLMNHSTTTRERASRVLCWFLLLLFTPVMILSTCYAVYNTFFRH